MTKHAAALAKCCKPAVSPCVRATAFHAGAMPLFKKAAYTPDLAPPQLTPDHEVLVVRFTGELCTAYECAPPEV